MKTLFGALLLFGSICWSYSLDDTPIDQYPFVYCFTRARDFHVQILRQPSNFALKLAIFSPGVSVTFPATQDDSQVETGKYSYSGFVSSNTVYLLMNLGSENRSQSNGKLYWVRDGEATLRDLQCALVQY